MKKFAIALLVIGVIGYGAFAILYPTTRLHARITIDVETPEGLKTGSSVQEIVFSVEPCPLCNTSGPKFRRHVRGEAVAVDLGPRGTLFALMVGGKEHPAPDPVTPIIVEMVFGPKQDKNWRGVEAVRALGRATGKADVPAELMPFMVRFRDVNDPKSVERVDSDNLAASFGPGVRLYKAKIEIVPSGWWPLNVFAATGTPLTTGIEKQLLWLPKLRSEGGALDGTRFPGTNDLKSNLGGGALKW